MARILTDKIVGALPAPKTGITIDRDSKVRGLGVRVLPSGTRAFVLDYTAAGRRRTFTIGKFPEWKIVAARKEAERLKRLIRFDGLDPAEELQEAREAPNVSDLCERFRKEHLPKLRPPTRRDYERIIAKDIIPRLGNRKVADIKFADIDRLHRAITERGAPVAANLCVALCSKLFNFAVRLHMRDVNPVRGLERNRVQPRNRYLSTAEIAALTEALDAYADQDIADLFRLLLLTGARRGETQAATWSQFNLEDGVWVKPSAATKQAREHRVPLSAAARQLLISRYQKAESELKRLQEEMDSAGRSELASARERQRRVKTFVFPAHDGATGHIVEIKKAWATLCKTAGIVSSEEVTDARTGRLQVVQHHTARIHDLRHTAASILASSGASLPLIGALLGHTQVATTARYSHLFDGAQREAVERLGDIVSGKAGKIVPLKRNRS